MPIIDNAVFPQTMLNDYLISFFRSSLPEVFLKKCALKISSKFKWENTHAEVRFQWSCKATDDCFWFFQSDRRLESKTEENKDYSIKGFYRKASVLSSVFTIKSQIFWKHDCWFSKYIFWIYCHGWACLNPIFVYINSFEIDGIIFLAINIFLKGETFHIEYVVFYSL